MMLPPYGNATRTVWSGLEGSLRYAARNSAGNVTVGAVVTLYDQYGNLMKTPGQTVTVSIDGTVSNPARPGSSGKARWTRSNFSRGAGDSIPLAATIIDVAGTADFVESSITVTGVSITAVDVARDDTPVTTAGDVSAVHDKLNKFVMSNTLYSYDSDDVFILGTAAENKELSLDEFETAIGAGITSPTTVAQVLIPRYDDGGSSTFVVTRKAAA